MIKFTFYLYIIYRIDSNLLLWYYIRKSVRKILDAKLINEDWPQFEGRIWAFIIVLRRSCRIANVGDRLWRLTFIHNNVLRFHTTTSLTINHARHLCCNTITQYNFILCFMLKLKTKKKNIYHTWCFSRSFSSINTIPCRFT